jgi:glycine/D-amino acid oxidase-like deaminating enzyme
MPAVSAAAPIASIIADLAAARQPRIDIAPFSPDHFS